LGNWNREGRPKVAVGFCPGVTVVVAGVVAVAGVIVTTVSVDGVKLVMPPVSGLVKVTEGPKTVTGEPGEVTTGSGVPGLIVTVLGPGRGTRVFGSRKTVAPENGF
jgi:hypothetical protein